MNEQEKTLRTLRKMAALGQPRGLGPASFTIAMQNCDDFIIRGMGFDPKDYNLGRGVILTTDHFRVQAAGPQVKVVATNIKGVVVRLGDVVEVLTDNGMASACYSGPIVSIESDPNGNIGVEAPHGIDYIPFDVIDRLRVVPQPSPAQPIGLNPKAGDGMILDTPCGLVLEARVISPAKACSFVVEIEAHSTTTRSKIPIAVAVGMRFSVSIHNQPTAQLPLPAEYNIGPARLTLYDPQGQTTFHYNAPFVRLTMTGASGVPMRNQQQVAQGGFNGTPLDPATASTDSVAGLSPCDYCNGLGRYDPFVGPTTDCPKCSGTGNVTP